MFGSQNLCEKPRCPSTVALACGGLRQDSWGLLATGLAPGSVHKAQENTEENEKAYHPSLALICTHMRGGWGLGGERWKQIDIGYCLQDKIQVPW